MYSRKLRLDIQILRAVAVLLVLWFHAQLPGLAGGFLGVDIFLVISGYLITGVVARGIEERRFSISGFYFNRAKRLLPASYTVFLMTGVLGLWLLTESEFQRYLDTLFGALTFTANIVLWQGTDYFSVGAKYNVLLHVWSLSLEEQFYFLLPFAMILAPKRFWCQMAVVGLLLSLILNFFLVQDKPVASFYLLPTRAWELFIGVVLALREDRLNLLLPVWASKVGPFAFALLIVVPVIMPFAALGSLHPGLDALVVTLATATIILLRPSFMNDSTHVTRVAVWVGNISYSLYLVHWPLFALARNAYVTGEAPISVRLPLLMLSFALAWALYVWVERPIHRLHIGTARLKIVAVILMTTTVVFLVASSLPSLRTLPRDYSKVMRPNYGLGQHCDMSEAFQINPACQSGDSPETLLWGDSFAMHIAQALPSNLGPFVQKTMSGCAPAVGIAQINPEAGQTRAWAERCIAFNDAVFQYLEAHPEIQTVILSSVYDQVLDQERSGLVRDANQILVVGFDQSIGFSHYEETVTRLRVSGRRVLLIGPTPTAGVNLAVCAERREMGLVTLGEHSDCLISREIAKKFRSSAFQLIDHLGLIDGVDTIDIFDVFCDATTCRPVRDNVILFRDTGHISVEGAEYIREHNLLIVNEK
jgi:peptidoglycan/LPS O-acetylase OafA/YrhL